MSSTRRRIALIAVLATLMAGLAMPAPASAVVYCVPNTGIHPSCEMSNASVQGALTAAEGTTMVADTVRIGPGTFNENDLNYFTNMTENTLDVIGSGTSATTLTRTDTTGAAPVFNFQAPGPSSVSDLRAMIPTPNDAGATDSGLLLGLGVIARRVVIDGGTSNLSGAIMGGTTTLDDSSVVLTTDMSAAAVSQDSGSPTVTDSTLTARTGVRHSGGGLTTTVERSVINAGLFGVSADSGTIIVRNSVIDLGTNANSVGVSPVNPNQSISPITATVEGSTIVGGGANSIGVRTRAESEQIMMNEADDMVNDGETSTATVRSTVISGPATAVIAEADLGEVATVTTDHSNYTAPAVEDDDISNGNATGNATLVETNKTTHAVPGFVNPAMGDYHLLASSPLVDIGDPAAPMGGDLDIDGQPRALSMTGTCAGPVAGRRDIGADEFSPEIPPSCNPVIPTPVNPAQTGPAPAKVCPKKKRKKKKRRSAVAAKKKKKKKRC